mgnify:CR=1 FL=1
MSKHDNISLIELSNYVKPEVEEVPGRKWVLNGKDNSFFQYIIDIIVEEGAKSHKALILTETVK